MEKIAYRLIPKHRPSVIARYVKCFFEGGVTPDYYIDRLLMRSDEIRTANAIIKGLMRGSF